MQRPCTHWYQALVGCQWIILALLCWPDSRCVGAMQTTATTYQYNADGALTAVTTQVGAQSPSTVYLTWDDFVPGTVDPASGQVLAGNGNLIGFGPTPGSSDRAPIRPVGIRQPWATPQYRYR